MKSYKALTALLLFATMRSGTFADTVSLLPQKDNTLYEDPAGQLSNGQGIYLFAGLTDDEGLRRGLIAFDLASIPTKATITGATLSMFLSRSGPSSATVNISLSKALRDCGEGASNADWQDNPAQAAEITAAGLAPTNNIESGIAATLPPGLYTALLAGRNNGTGVGLVEIYDCGGGP
jgi:hypothetical protein